MIKEHGTRPSRDNFNKRVNGNGKRFLREVDPLQLVLNQFWEGLQNECSEFSRHCASIGRSL